MIVEIMVRHIMCDHAVAERIFKLAHYVNALSPIIYKRAIKFPLIHMAPRKKADCDFYSAQSLHESICCG